ncbi:MAG: phosphatase PAP2 family protein [Aquabacterium sp.]|nr:MAG: phosphatase PAP2 family protein [Aquabacterium sp.]
MTAAPAAGPGRMPWHDRLAWIALPLSVLAFVLWPGLDLALTRRVYDSKLGFLWRDEAVVQALYLGVPWTARALILGALLLWLYARFKPGSVRPLWQHTAALAVAAGLLGPGLVVEGVLKPFWQRPRPVQVLEFGGTHAYEPPFHHCADCNTHHSFVSGHAAAGFALLTLGLASGPRGRRRWLAAGLLAGTVTGAGRILQGGHFLSDIVYAFYAVWLSAQLVMWLDRQRARAAA